MTPLQGEPPKLDFKLPRKLKKWLMALRQFAIEIQPLNGSGLSLSQQPKGRLLKVGDADDIAAEVAAPFRLQILNATADVSTPKYRVRYGKVAGLVADAGMTLGDDPTFEKTVSAPGAGTYYVYCKLPASYNSIGKWTFTAGSILEYTSEQSDTTSFAYVEIGAFTLATVSGGYSLTVNTPQAVEGDQAVARDGDGTADFHKNWSTP